MTAKDHVVHPPFSTQNTWTVQGPGAGDTTMTRTNWSLVFFHLYLGQTGDKQVIKNRYRQVTQEAFLEEEAFAIKGPNMTFQ